MAPGRRSAAGLPPAAAALRRSAPVRWAAARLGPRAPSAADQAGLGAPAQQALPTGEGWQPSHHAQHEQSRYQPPPVQRSGSGGKWALAVAAVVVLGVLAYFFWPSTGSGFDVKVTKCQSTGSVATVGLSVHNNGSSTQTATIRVEYHDKAGKLIDSDTVLVHDIGAGDTKAAEQSTILDADEAMTCHVTAAA